MLKAIDTNFGWAVSVTSPF